MESIYKKTLLKIKGEIKERNLMIIPSGIFTTIPFEALVDEDGRFLVETKNIYYALSHTSNEQIGYRYADKPGSLGKRGDTQPIVVFGGAEYQLKCAKNRRAYSPRGLKILKKYQQQRLELK